MTSDKRKRKIRNRNLRQAICLCTHCHQCASCQELVFELKKAFFWLRLNFVCLAVVLYDMYDNHTFRNFYLELIILLIFCCNSWYHLNQYYLKNNRIKNRLRIFQNPVKPQDTEDRETLFVTLNPHFENKYKDTGSMPSFNDPSSGSRRTSRGTSSAYIPLVRPLFTKINGKDVNFLTTKEDIRAFIREFNKAQENEIIVARSCDPGEKENYFQFWSPPQEYSGMSPPSLLRNTVYQHSQGTRTSNLSSVGEVSILPINSNIWKQFRVNPLNLLSWITNIRTWIAKTILHRITNEITHIDNGLKNMGMISMSIGEVGLDTLITTAHMPQIALNVPTLALLIPFLEISKNQRYVVQRIKELADGNTIKDFSWKSGGQMHNNSWELHLPTDAELIMHLVATYMDTQLPLLQTNPQCPPFTTQYFKKTEKPTEHTEIAIYQKTAFPPHFQLIIQNEVYDIPPGGNNAYFALLLFFYYIRLHNDGMLGRINLGPSGLNMLWIVEEHS